MKRVLFIINPNAGKGQIRGKLLEILDLFSAEGWQVVTYVTQSHGDATQMVHLHGLQYDLILCSGGDGTARETVCGLMQLPQEQRPPLGYIPAGTTNDYAASLGLNRNMEAAAMSIIHGKPFACDIGLFGEEYFTYIAAFGAFTAVSYQTPQQSKNVLGHLAYVLEGIRSITSIKPYHLVVEHDGVQMEDDFIFGMVTNSISVGGFKNLTQSGVKMDDGVFEVALIRHPRTLMDLQEIVYALVNQEENQKHILTFHSSHIRLTCTEDLPWTLDGEFGGSVKQVDIRNLKQVVQIVRG